MFHGMDPSLKQHVCTHSREMVRDQLGIIGFFWLMYCCFSVNAENAKKLLELPGERYKEQNESLAFQIIIIIILRAALSSKRLTRGKILF
jgi:hypothetical protein